VNLAVAAPFSIELRARAAPVQPRDVQPVPGVSKRVASSLLPRLPGGLVNTRNGARGATFVELIIAVSIIGILVAAAVPTFQDASRSQTVAARIAVLHQDLSFARAEAVKLQENVLLVAPSSDWADGWQVFVDNDGQRDFDPGEPTLRSQGPMPEGYSMDVADGPGDAKTSVGFSSRGAVVDGNSHNVVACAPGWTTTNDKAYARNARIAANGRAESGRGTGAGAGISCT